MSKTVVKLQTLLLGFLFLIYVLHVLRGGSLAGDLLIGRKLTSRVETTNVATRSLKDSVSSTDLEREVDHLMRHEYPSPVNPKKRSPVHN
ncbi:hypothetical protein F2Q68_00022702 [Brassica cretica]|uniref:Uncharacterized protein n=2 Tax=Brassica TaxID=3705 RepID=A0A8S9G6Y7_BRACR|nr:PREDICTED: uncharacterized protein LOC106317778 [Brassica oleracea var. oleracea]KAF2538982.1 hypothetical protein F2Q68_00022702 [Brassica cretica]VDD33657.1 unnamed protein product [Brassica oleracea]